MVRISMALLLLQPPAGGETPPADAPPPIQRPSTMGPAEPAPAPPPAGTPPAPNAPPAAGAPTTPAPSDTPPAPSTPPVGEAPFEPAPAAPLPPPVEPEPLPPPTPEGPVAAESVEPPPPPAQTNPLSRKHAEPDGPPRGPGTYFMAGGGVLMAASIAVTVVALASPSFAAEPRQRAAVVPIGLVGLSAGSALLIVGVRRHIRTRRWNERSAALLPSVAPAPGGAMAGLTGRF